MANFGLPLFQAVIVSFKKSFYSPYFDLWPLSTMLYIVYWIIIHDFFSGHYCPNGTKVSNQYPCPAGTFNNGTGLRWDTECSACLGLFQQIHFIYRWTC